MHLGLAPRRAWKTWKPTRPERRRPMRSAARSRKHSSLLPRPRATRPSCLWADPEPACLQRAGWGALLPASQALPRSSLCLTQSRLGQRPWDTGQSLTKIQSALSSFANLQGIIKRSDYRPWVCMTCRAWIRLVLCKGLDV